MNVSIASLMSKQITCVLLFFLGFLSFLDASHWDLTSRSGDTASFYFYAERRIENYDLVTEEWLDSVELPEKDAELTAALVDEEVIYAAYGSSLYRYDKGGAGEVLVLEGERPIVKIVGNESHVFTVVSGNSFNGGSLITSIQKSDHSLVDSVESYFQKFRNAQVSPDGKSLFGYDYGNQYSRCEIDEQGYLGGVKLLTSNDGEPMNGRFWFYPDGSRIVNELGEIIDTYSATRIHHFGKRIEDVAFRGDDVPVGVVGGDVVAFHADARPSGRVDVHQPVRKIFAVSDAVIAFSLSEAVSSGISTTRISYESLEADEPGLLINPLGLAFDPETVYMGPEGALHLFAREYQSIFRWDPATQTFLTSLSLEGAPEEVVYSAELERLYVLYSDGRITSSSLSDVDFVQRDFLPANGRGRWHMVAAGSYLLLGDKNNTGYYSYDRRGTEMDKIGVSVRADDTFIWDGVHGILLFDNLYSYEFRAKFAQNPHLEYGHFGVMNYHTEFGGIDLVGLTPNNEYLVTRGGSLIDPLTLRSHSHSLGNPVTAIASAGASLKSMREIEGVTRLQSWSVPEFTVENSEQLLGLPLHLVAADPASLIAVVSGSDGIPSFYHMNNDFTMRVPASLEPPSSLQAQVLSATSVQLSWPDVSGESGYVIERANFGEENWSEIGRVGTSVTRFKDSNLEVGSSYLFRVTSVNGELTSEPVIGSEVKIDQPGSLMNLRVSEVGETEVYLQWEPLDLVSVFEVEWSKNGSSWGAESEPPNGEETGFVLSDLDDNTEYFIRVRGSNAVGNGSWSMVTAKTLPPFPETPTNLRLRRAPLSYEISLIWSGSTSGVSIVERLQPDGSWAEVSRMEDYQFTDRGVEPSTSYVYRVRNENIRGVSNYSEPFATSTSELVEPARPSIVSLANIADGVLLNFYLNDPTADILIIERQVDESDSYVEVGRIDADEKSNFVDTTSVPGFSYRYRVVARNMAGDSSPSLTQEILALDGVCLSENTFDSGALGYESVTGGEIVSSGGAGFPVSGGVLWFGGAFERILELEPVERRYGGTLSVTLRMASEEVEDSEYWDVSERYENIEVEFYNEVESSWERLGSIDATVASSKEWNTYHFVYSSNGDDIIGDDFGSNAGGNDEFIRIRLRQTKFNGPGRDTWAVDSYCLLGNRPENVAPRFNPDMPDSMVATVWEPTLQLNVAQYVSEENPVDSTYYAIGEVSNPALFSTFEIDLESGLLNIVFAPYVSGSSELEIIVTDRAGARATKTITISTPAYPKPVVTREGAVALNPLTGLYEQSITFSNNGSRTIAGAALTVTYLNADFVIYGHDSNVILHQEEIPSGESATITLEYHSPTSGIQPRPNFDVSVWTPEVALPVGNGPNEVGLSLMDDASRLLTFDGEVGQEYQIEYSNDAVRWSSAGSPIVAGSSQVYWLDQGLPKTDCHPSECGRRFYRAVAIGE